MDQREPSTPHWSEFPMVSVILYDAARIARRPPPLPQRTAKAYRHSHHTSSSRAARTAAPAAIRRPDSPLRIESESGRSAPRVMANFHVGVAPVRTDRVAVSPSGGRPEDHRMLGRCHSARSSDLPSVPSCRMRDICRRRGTTRDSSSPVVPGPAAAGPVQSDHASNDYRRSLSLDRLAAVGHGLMWPSRGNGSVFSSANGKSWG